MDVLYYVCVCVIYVKMRESARDRRLQSCVCARVSEREVSGNTEHTFSVSAFYDERSQSGKGKQMRARGGKEEKKKSEIERIWVGRKASEEFWDTNTHTHTYFIVSTMLGIARNPSIWLDCICRQFYLEIIAFP